MYSSGISIKQEGSNYTVTVDDGYVTSDGRLNLGSTSGNLVIDSTNGDVILQTTSSGNIYLDTGYGGDKIYVTAGTINATGNTTFNGSTSSNGAFSLTSGNTLTVTGSAGQNVTVVDGVIDGLSTLGITTTAGDITMTSAAGIGLVTGGSGNVSINTSGGGDTFSVTSNTITLTGSTTNNGAFGLTAGNTLTVLGSSGENVTVVNGVINSAGVLTLSNTIGTLAISTTNGHLTLGTGGGGQIYLDATGGGDVIHLTASTIDFTGASTHDGNFTLETGHTLTVTGGPGSQSGNVTIVDGYVTAAQGVVINSTDNSPHVRFASADNFIMGLDRDNSNKFILSSSTSLSDEPRITINKGLIGINTNSPSSTSGGYALDVHGVLIVSANPTSGVDSKIVFREGGSSQCSIGYDDGLDSFVMASGGSLGDGDYWLIAKDASLNQIAVGNSPTVDASASFKIQATLGGFLQPVMTTAQKNAIGTPTTGLTVFDSDLNTIEIYENSAWRSVVHTGKEVVGEIHCSGSLKTGKYTSSAIPAVHCLGTLASTAASSTSSSDTYVYSAIGTISANTISAGDAIRLHARARITSLAGSAYIDKFSFYIKDDSGYNYVIMDSGTFDSNTYWLSFTGATVCVASNNWECMGSGWQQSGASTAFGVNTYAISGDIADDIEFGVCYYHKADGSNETAIVWSAVADISSGS